LLAFALRHSNYALATNRKATVKFQTFHFLPTAEAIVAPPFYDAPVKGEQRQQIQQG